MNRRISMILALFLVVPPIFSMQSSKVAESFIELLDAKKQGLPINYQSFSPEKLDQMNESAQTLIKDLSATAALQKEYGAPIEQIQKGLETALTELNQIISLKSSNPQLIIHPAPGAIPVNDFLQFINAKITNQAVNYNVPLQTLQSFAQAAQQKRTELNNTVTMQAAHKMGIAPRELWAIANEVKKDLEQAQSKPIPMPEVVKAPMVAQQSAPIVQPAVSDRIFDVDWGYSSRQGRRPTMEDTHIALPNFVEKRSLFAVFDGHGGSKAADAAALFFPQYLENDLLKNPNGSRGIALENAFERMEKYIIDTHIADGTTAAVSFLEEGILRMVWVGDSRQIVIRDGKVIKATVDHKPDAINEKARIESVGGTVYFDNTWRINGLAMARSLGDIVIKNETPGAIIPKPDISRVEIKDGDILVNACDGLWDVFSNKEVAELVTDLIGQDSATIRYMYPQEKPLHEVADEDGKERMRLIARGLRDQAYNKGSTDNISVMVIQFKKKRAPAHLVEQPNRVLPKLARNKIKVLDELRALRDSMVNDADKSSIGAFYITVKTKYNPENLALIRQALQKHTNDPVNYFGQQATAQELITNVIKHIDQDINTLQ